MSVDSKSYELAEHFLDDEGVVPERAVMRLAQVIQDAIEDWIAEYNEGRKQDRQQSGPDRDEWRHEAVEQQRVK